MCEVDSSERLLGQCVSGRCRLHEGDVPEKPSSAGYCAKPRTKQSCWFAASETWDQLARGLSDNGILAAKMLLFSKTLLVTKAKMKHTYIRVVYENPELMHIEQS